VVERKEVVTVVVETVEEVKEVVRVVVEMVDVVEMVVEAKVGETVEGSEPHILDGT
tara:strand:+ start:70 stop:237 length:168 start_codon:yes stop_codon:yes gene_type:complete